MIATRIGTSPSLGRSREPSARARVAPSRGARWLLGALSCLSLLPLAAPAAAQGSEPAAGADVARARQEFREGTECVQRADHDCAAAHFRAALELHDAATIRYNLASSLFELGQYPESARLAQSLVGDGTVAEDLRAHARALARQIREEGGIARVVIRGAAGGVAVRIDGQVVPNRQLSGVPVSAGTHTVLATRGSQPPARGEFTMERGGRQTVELALVGSASEAAERSYDIPEEGEPEDPRGNRRRAIDGPVLPVEGERSVPLEEDWRFWTVFGVVGGLVTIAVLSASIAAATSGP